MQTRISKQRSAHITHQISWRGVILTLILLGYGCSGYQVVTTKGQTKAATATTSEVVDLLVPRGLESMIMAGDKIGLRDLQLTSMPSNGVVRIDSQTGTVKYQHGGASKEPDQFELSWVGKNAINKKRLVRLRFREVSANIQIRSPSNGAVLPAGDVHVEYNLSGEDFDHLHIALDHKGHNTIRDLTGRFTLAGVTQGEHTVSAQLVDANHRAIRAVQASDEVTITIK